MAHNHSSRIVKSAKHLSIWLVMEYFSNLIIHPVITTAKAETPEFIQKPLQIKQCLALPFAKYFTAPNTPNTNETDLDLSYTFPKSSRFKGLSIRNRFSILTGNASLSTFYANRLMLQYSF